MRYFYRQQRVNYDFIRREFGDGVIASLKCWSNLNYKSIRLRSRLEFLKLCRNNSVVPMHLSHISDSKFYLKNFKAKRNLNRLVFSTRHKILNIEIFDLHRQLHKITSKITMLGRKLSGLLPVYIWNDLYDKKNFLFSKYACKIEQINNKKYSWLLKKRDRENLSDIKYIEFQVYRDINNSEIVYKFKYGQNNNKDLQKITDITISPKMYEDVDSKGLLYTNDKWFINLSSKAIPLEVSNL